MTSRPWVVGLLLIAACGDDTGPPDALRIDAELADGTVSLTWTITNPGGTATCAEVGADFVSLTLIPVDQPFGMTDVVDCDPGSGTTRGFTPDTYNVTVSLGGTDAPDIVFRDVVIMPAQDTPMGNAAFEVP
jgi:hypothetical protein